LSTARWEQVVAEAVVRAKVFDRVIARHERTGASLRSSVAAVSPGLPWPTFARWKRRHGSGEGASWERLLDERAPPHVGYDGRMRVRACILRRADPGMNTDMARSHLVAEFGEAGRVSDTWLRREWQKAGLKHVRAAQRGPVAKCVAAPAGENVEYFPGGGGLALIAAAEAEVGCVRALAEAALKVGKERVSAQVVTDDMVDDRADRGEAGKFTAQYNARRRGSTPPGHADARMSSDADKAALRPLATLQVLSRRTEALAHKMLAMGVSPMVMQGRGFDGLVSPTGAWLGALGSTAYMPATLDKALAELGLLDVDEAMWRTHARSWHAVTKPWADPDEKSWLRTAVYIDGTADPYWTDGFAKSGKVSRVGRVMPCLSRIAVNSGAGVPLLVETHVGAVSLKKRLLPMLDQLDAAIGPGAAVERLTVVDSEAGTAGMMWAMHSQTKMNFITVIKGKVLQGALIHDEGPWQKYRERDELREVKVDVHGKGAPGKSLTYRGVEMRRGNSRHPHTTLFASNTHEDDLPTAQLADYYLARWPHQEQVFRNARNGCGLNHSHGYGGGEVQHVALVPKLEKAGRAVAAAQQRLETAKATRTAIAKALRKASPDARKAALALADKGLRAAEKQSERAVAELQRLDTMPKQIFERDTGRDAVMTCLKVTVMTLLEFVLKDYFGGAAMEWSTFIAQLVPMPLTVRSSPERCLYQLHANPRHPTLMAALQAAVAEINRRDLRRGGQRLLFEITSAPPTGP